MKPKLERIVIWGVLAAFAGCNAAAQGQRENPPSMPPVTTPPTGPVEGNPTPPPPPIVPTYSGTFDVPAPLDLTQNGVLPGVAGPTLKDLIALHDHPGTAIVELISEIPAVADLRSKVPGVVIDLLESLLDKLIINEVYKNVPIVEKVADLISGLTELTRTVTLDNRLTLHAPDANHAASVDLQPIGVRFTLLGNTTTVAFNTDELHASRTTLTATVLPRATAPAADADLTLMAGAPITLPFGQVALQAAGPLLFGSFGGATDLQGALEHLVPCHAWAQSLSDDIDDVIDADTIEAVCVGALDVIADTVTRQIDALVLTNVQISDASATLLDASAALPLVDHKADRIALGKWTWSFTIAGQTLHVPSTMEGERVGDAP